MWTLRQQGTLADTVNSSMVDEWSVYGALADRTNPTEVDAPNIAFALTVADRKLNDSTQ